MENGTSQVSFSIFILDNIDIETHQVFQCRTFPDPKGRALRSKVLKWLSFTVSKDIIFGKGNCCGSDRHL